MLQASMACYKGSFTFAFRDDFAFCVVVATAVKYQSGKASASRCISQSDEVPETAIAVYSLLHFYYILASCCTVLFNTGLHGPTWAETCSVEQRQLNVRPSTIKLHTDCNITSKLITSFFFVLRSIS
jgi:hypothetical protein